MRLGEYIGKACAYFNPLKIYNIVPFVPDMCTQMFCCYYFIRLTRTINSTVNSLAFYHCTIFEQSLARKWVNYDSGVEKDHRKRVYDRYAYPPEIDSLLRALNIDPGSLSENS